MVKTVQNLNFGVTVCVLCMCVIQQISVALVLAKVFLLPYVLTAGKMFMSTLLNIVPLKCKRINEIKLLK